MFECFRSWRGVWVWEWDKQTDVEEKQRAGGLYQVPERNHSGSSYANWGKIEKDFRDGWFHFIHLCKNLDWNKKFLIKSGFVIPLYRRLLSRKMIWYLPVIIREHWAFLWCTIHICRIRPFKKLYSILYFYLYQGKMYESILYWNVMI